MYKAWEVVRACDFSTQKVEGEGSEVKGCLCLQRKLQATLNYMRQSQEEKEGRKERGGRKEGGKAGRQYSGRAFS